MQQPRRLAVPLLAIGLALGLAQSACTSTPKAAPQTTTSSPTTPSTSPTPTLTPYTSPYPGIKITGPPLNPEQTKVVNAMAQYDYVARSMMEKLPKNFDAMKPLTTESAFTALQAFIRQSHKSGYISTGWSTEKILSVDIGSSVSTITSCSDSSSWKRENSTTIQRGLRVQIRTESLVKKDGRWVVSSDSRVDAYTTGFAGVCK